MTTILESANRDVVKVGAIDMGSNSFHLIITQLNADGQLEVLDSYKETIRLGQAFDTGKRLSRKAFDKAIRTLTTMKEICQTYNATIRAVATHATRIAENQAAFLAAIDEETGIKVEVIDGNEEARLIYQGVRSGISLSDKQVLAVDVGGGSTEFVIAQRDELQFISSLKLGAVNLADRFFAMEPPTQSGIKALRNHLLVQLGPVVADVSRFNFALAIATSGTAKTLASMHYRMISNRDIDDHNGYILTASDLEAIEHRLIKLGDPKKIRHEFDLDRRRSEIILSGTIVLRAIGEMLKVSEWKVSAYGFREGIALDTYARMRLLPESSFSNIRWHSIVMFGQKLAIDPEYANQTRILALKIFSQLESHFMPDELDPKRQLENRELLQAAAYLSEAGKFISYQNYNRHSYYIISQSNLLGYSQEEKHLIGLIAKFSRKKPATKETARQHDYFRNNFRRVHILSACLRIAGCLNRTRRQKISNVTIQFEPARAIITIYYIGESVPEVEIQTLYKEEGSLSKIFGLDIDYEVRHA